MFKLAGDGWTNVTPRLALINVEAPTRAYFRVRFAAVPWVCQSAKHQG